MTRGMGPRPRRHTPRPPPPFPASLHERNIAPAGHSTAWLTSSVKEISPLLAQNGQNTALFGVPGRRIFHGTPQHLTQGRFFFHPSSIPTHRRDTTHPARLYQRTRAKQFAQRPLFLLRCAKKFALQAQTGEKRCFQACWASFFAEMSLEGPCRASFFAPWDWQLGPSTGTPADARLNPIGGVVGSLPAQSPTGLTRAGCVHRSRS